MEEGAGREAGPMRRRLRLTVHWRYEITMPHRQRVVEANHAKTTLAFNGRLRKMTKSWTKPQFAVSRCSVCRGSEVSDVSIVRRKPTRQCRDSVELRHHVDQDNELLRGNTICSDGSSVQFESNSAPTSLRRRVDWLLHPRFHIQRQHLS